MVASVPPPGESQALQTRGDAPVELRSTKADELRKLAREFRARAAGCPPGFYHDLILQTADEIEEFANSLAATDGTERIARHEDETIRS